MIRVAIILALLFCVGCELIGYSAPGMEWNGQQIRLIYTTPAKPHLWPPQKPGSLVWRLESGAMVPLSPNATVLPTDTVVEYQGFCTGLVNGKCKLGTSTYYGVATAGNFDPAARGGAGAFYSTDETVGGFGPHVNAQGQVDGVITGFHGLTISGSTLNVLPGVPAGITIPAPPASELDESP